MGKFDNDDGKKDVRAQDLIARAFGCCRADDLDDGEEPSSIDFLPEMKRIKDCDDGAAGGTYLHSEDMTTQDQKEARKEYLIDQLKTKMPKKPEMHRIQTFAERYLKISAEYLRADERIILLENFGKTLFSRPIPKGEGMLEHCENLLDDCIAHYEK
ncbi:hypothetical protein HQ545_04025 [Candidatus Woesearchaeota archaeon]|nr:hypothetical protein [Candidatus Woesearchaeota archaeon]